MGERADLNDVLSNARLVFWDFDGVIKESLAVKTEAFGALFAPFGHDVMDRVREHHIENGGMSRLEKMPLYLAWAGQPVTGLNVHAYCQRFSKAVLTSVIAAPWVPGVERYLRSNQYRQEFVLVTATPQQEIEEILTALDLCNCFSDVFGAPTQKGIAIRQALANRDVQSSDCLMVGDAIADIDAARQNDVPFLLRRHHDNQHVFWDYRGAFVEDFSGI